MKKIELSTAVITRLNVLSVTFISDFYDTRESHLRGDKSPSNRPCVSTAVPKVPISDRTDVKSPEAISEAVTVQ